MTTRRKFLKDSLSLIGIGATATLIPQILNAAELLDGTKSAATLEALPSKKPLIKRTYRPINYEIPTEYLADVFTPNDAFFVRWHLTNVPEITPDEWRLNVLGGTNAPIQFTLDELKKNFKQIELAAVCQCGGNRRGFSAPHVPGIQWGNGAMGNAKWKGVRLKDVLERAGIPSNAIEVAFNGADLPAFEKTPDFVKSIPIEKAMHPDTLIAFEMNGEPLPHLNGGPARIVVPGWIASYWMKKVTEINLMSDINQSFWMSTAYRTPKGIFSTDNIFPSQEKGKDSAPVTEMLVNSLITNPTEGQTFPVDSEIRIQGIAWDSGNGIKHVEISLDNGISWVKSQLSKNYGRYSFRQWTHQFLANKTGPLTILVKATSNTGISQSSNLIFNPSGYHNNIIQRVNLEVTPS
jgi:sulfite dehydrogenase (cytochrome) subunit A